MAKKSKKAKRGALARKKKGMKKVKPAKRTKAKPTARIAAIAPAPMPGATLSTPKQFVYDVITHLRPNNQIKDDTPLATLAWDDFESKDVLRWEIDRRHWRGVDLPVGALAKCTNVSDVTDVVDKAMRRVKPPNAQANPTPVQPKPNPETSTS